MLYFIQATVYSALFYAVYALLLRDRATHGWSRAYLLAISGISLLLPLADLGAAFPVAAFPAFTVLPAVDVIAGATYKAKTIGGNWLLYGYVAVAVGMLLVFIGQLLVCLLFLRRAKVAKYIGKVHVLSGTGRGPGSFGKYIFFPGTDLPQDIVAHELAHLGRWHTADVVYMRLLQCIFWPNLMLRLIGRELRVVHEFEADAYAASDKDGYVHSLLHAIFPGQKFDLSHTFSHHPIKRRIIMLQKPKNSAMLRIAIARSAVATLLLASSIIYLQSCTRKQETPAALVKQEVAATPAIEGNTVAARATIDIPTFMGKHMKYPQQARDKKIEGKVLVSFTVNERGEVVLATVKRSPDPLLAAEALRVIELMPKWEPATKDGKPIATEMCIPVHFKLQ